MVHDMHGVCSSQILPSSVFSLPGKERKKRRLFQSGQCIRLERWMNTKASCPKVHEQHSGVFGSIGCAVCETEEDVQTSVPTLCNLLLYPSKPEARTISFCGQGWGYKWDCYTYLVHSLSASWTFLKGRGKGEDWVCSLCTPSPGFCRMIFL